MKSAQERFLKYISFETTSSESSGVRPSTACQNALGDYLLAEMRELGLKDVYRSDADGAVFGTIPANTDKEVPIIGFLAHMDTSPAASGKDVKSRVVKNYDGGEIVLNQEQDIKMSPALGFTCLNEVIGEDLIVTDGTTLLGADDKAGIAEIMTMAETLLHSDRPHGEIHIGFTTDEEIGAGPDLFDVKAFGCDFAYTVDGGPIGEIEYENFNAAAASVMVQGVGVHPGAAKNLMKNAASIAMEFHKMLPVEQVPEHTEGYEGFIGLMGMKGDVTGAELHYIIRDHDMEKFLKKKQIMEAAAEYINAKYGCSTITLNITDNYYNMRSKIAPHMHLVESAKAAFRTCGIEPKSVPIRGGTDGARLSFVGLPCPNLSACGYQFHGIYEFIPVAALNLMPDVLTEIACHYGEGKM